MGAGLDLTARHRDGRLIPVDVALSTIRTPDGPFTIAAVRDLGEHRRKDEQLRRQLEYVRLLRSVATAANEAASPEAALQAAVDQVCTVMRWPLGHVFLPTADRTRLVSTAIWHLCRSRRRCQTVSV